MGKLEDLVNELKDIILLRERIKILMDVGKVYDKVDQLDKEIDGLNKDIIRYQGENSVYKDHIEEKRNKIDNRNDINRYLAKSVLKGISIPFSIILVAIIFGLIFNTLWVIAPVVLLYFFPPIAYGTLDRFAELIKRIKELANTNTFELNMEIDNLIHKIKLNDSRVEGTTKTLDAKSEEKNKYNDIITTSENLIEGLTKKEEQLNMQILNVLINNALNNCNNVNNDDYLQFIKEQLTKSTDISINVLDELFDKAVEQYKDIDLKNIMKVYENQLFDPETGFKYPKEHRKLIYTNSNMPNPKG